MSTEVGTSKVARLSGTSFDAYNADVQSAALKATKLAVALPADINFNRTVDNDFAQAIDSCSERALRLTNSLLELSIPNNSSHHVKGKRKLEDQEDAVDRFGSLVVDVLDQLFERVDMSLDEYLGRIKPIAIPVKPPSSTSPLKIPKTRSGRLDPSILHAADLPKPQLKFRRKVDNSNVSPWRPKLKHKYNAQVPLAFTFGDSMYANEDSGLGSSAPHRSHPYFYEIKHISYPRHMFEHRDPTAPLSFEKTPYTWISTKEGLDALLVKLRCAQEIAVDLEHHSYRSFSGFLCLMQISTREEDFILDTLALREELEDLNEVFTTPKIVKVFHGAESDIVWLQQDLNIYIVNLFDTYHASKLLDFPRHGLGALLEMYCDFVPDKRYQLADWRIRPLPDAMVKYARGDTHFLLYVYDNLRNALLDRARGQSDLIRAVLDHSEETALRVYEPEVYDSEDGNGPGGWNTLALKWDRALSGLPLAVFRAVHSWRDSVARAEDESTRYVLPNHYLFQLAERPPADMAALLAIFRPVPPLVRTKAASLLDVIRAAVGETLQKASTEKENEKTSRPQTGVHDRNEHISLAAILHEPSVPSENASTRIEKTYSDVWKRPSVEGIAAASSSLLGSQSSAAKYDVDHRLSARSALFPTGWTTNNTGKRFAGPSLTRYQEVVSRIHSTVVVAPIIQNVPVAAAETEQLAPTVTSTSATSSEVVSEQIEIPFVPANQRQLQSVVKKVETTDAIMTVGRTREKKRKRSKRENIAENLDKGRVTKKSRGGTTDVDGGNEAVEMKNEEFDYSSAPNFLDQPIRDQHVLLELQKAKASKDRRPFELGNFPAPPRAYNEVKGANMSCTFKR